MALVSKILRLQINNLHFAKMVKGYNIIYHSVYAPKLNRNSDYGSLSSGNNYDITILAFLLSLEQHRKSSLRLDQLFKNERWSTKQRANACYGPINHSKPHVKRVETKAAEVWKPQ